MARFCVLTGKPRRQIFSRQGRNILDANYEHCPSVSQFTTDAKLTNFSPNYLVMCRVYTDVGGIKYLYHVCPPVRKIIHSLKLVDYLHVQADNPGYNMYMYQSFASTVFEHIRNYTTFTNFYLVVCRVYTDVGGIK